MLWYCKACTAAYAPAVRCPNCGSTDHTDRPPEADLVGDRGRRVAGESAELDGEPGPAENVDTGEVTPAGEPLPEAEPAPKRTRK